MKYATVVTNYPGVPKGEPVIYIDTEDSIKRFSESKGADEFFNSWYESAKKAGDKNLKLEQVIEASDDDIIEVDDYSGEKKTTVAKMIEKFGYDAP
jgi:hypothetical protein